MLTKKQTQVLNYNKWYKIWQRGSSLSLYVVLNSALSQKTECQFKLINLLDGLPSAEHK